MEFQFGRLVKITYKEARMMTGQMQYAYESPDNFRRWFEKTEDVDWVIAIKREYGDWGPTAERRVYQLIIGAFAAVLNRLEDSLER